MTDSARRADYTDMLFGRYIGIVREFLYGDIEHAKELRLVALKQLGGMRHLLLSGGDLTGKRRVTLPDGAIIETIWDGTMNIVRIITSGAQVPEGDEYLYPYLSGLQEIASVAAPLDGPYQFASQFYPAWQVPNGRALQWYQYNVGYSSFDWPITPTDAETIESDPDVAFIHDWVKTTLPNIDAGPLGLKGFPNWPGMYTGKMRLVAQKALGYRRSIPFSLNSGIWTPDGPEEYADERQRWVIEISITDGVTAYPISFIEEMRADGVDQSLTDEADRERYDYGLPEGFTIPSIVSDNPMDAFGDDQGNRYRYRLLDAETVLSISENKGTVTPWYPNWAFSYSGREAQIVLIGRKAYSTNIDPGVAFAQRYKISFTQGAMLIGGRTVQYPSLATIELIEEGYLFTNQYNFELYAPVIHPYQEHIYFDAPSPVPEPRDAPIYVFYTRDDREVVLKRKDVGAVSVNSDQQDGIDCLTEGCIIPCVYCDQPYHPSSPSGCANEACQRYGYTAELCYQGQIEHRSGMEDTATYYCDRTYQAESNFNGNKYGTYRWVDWDESPIETNQVICNLLFYDYVRMTSALQSKGYQLVTTNHSEYERNSTTAILPLYDREGFFHVKSRSTTYSGSFNRKLDSLYIWRCYKITGPYANMPEVTAIGESAFAYGTWSTESNITNQPDDEISSNMVYIGSVNKNSFGAIDSVISLDDPPSGAVFGDGMLVTAAVEMFAGRSILAPHPPVIDDGLGGEKTNLIVSGVGADGGEPSYPALDAYRPTHRASPMYFCFIGDGNIDVKVGDVDMNAISYLENSDG